MSNPIYEQMKGSQYGNMNGIVQRFNQFRSGFNGDPRQQVQELLNSGKISQEQYDQAVKTANAMRNMFGI